MNVYDPHNWYWLASDGRLCSSADQLIVPTTDGAYEAWLAAGNTPTQWPRDTSGNQTIQSMQDVLTPYGLFASLVGYAQSIQQKIAAGGITVNVGTSGSPVSVNVATDPASLTLLQGATMMAQANSSASFQWVQSSGVSVTLTATQITALFTAVSAFIQATFTALTVVINGINDGSITTTAQVDSWAWPAATVAIS
jgi:hypothetical protein